MMYQCAKWRPIPETRTQSSIKPRAVVLHTAVDGPGADSLHGYFAAAKTVVESHFFIQRDGTIEQYVDTHRRADAQGDGNDFCISVETEDDGRPATTPWNQLQIAAIRKLLVEAHRSDGIPLQLIDRWNGKGVGYHSQFPQWNKNAHACPGRLRQSQIPLIVMGAALDAGLGHLPPPPAGPPLAPPQPKPTPPVRQVVGLGNAGHAVEVLQFELAWLGQPVQVDGHFGPKTRDAVLAIQKWFGLPQSGIADTATWFTIDTCVILKGGQPG